MLVPGTGGVFDLELDGELVWSKHGLHHNGYPKPEALIPLVRERFGRELL